MFMDEEANLYFMMQYKGNLIKILKTNSNAEMNDEHFIHSIFEFRSERVHFFQLYRGKFYLMDASKKIKIFNQDPNTKMLTLE